MRVVTQTQLERLHPVVPGRTMRYRTKRLHQLRLLGRTRPYRDSGSAPHHWWPTRRGDALVRGQAPPRRGERRTPNPLTLSHNAAISELYVVLATEAGEAGLQFVGIDREADARETFKDPAGRERAIAPDLLIELRDRDGRRLLAHVEPARSPKSRRPSRTRSSTSTSAASSPAPGSSCPPCANAAAVISSTSPHSRARSSSRPGDLRRQQARRRRPRQRRPRRAARHRRDPVDGAALDRQHRTLLRHPDATHRRANRVEPDAIADAIVASVSHRRAEVAVPRWLGAYPIVQPLVPEFVENLVRRLFDDDAALTTSTLPAAPPTTSASPGRFRPRTPPP